MGARYGLARDALVAGCAASGKTFAQLVLVWVKAFA